MKMTLEEAAQAMNAMCDFETLGRKIISRVRIDSRLVQKGDLFFCIQGRNMDGHQFVQDAISRGAAAVVAHKMPGGQAGEQVPFFLVRDTTIALGQLAGYWRSKAGKTVIGITGSAGKTTTKEMLASVLSQSNSVGKNFKNWNNQIGLPMSILELSGEERFWILELGINSPRDMDDLGIILRPDIGLIVNAGPCHVQGLGDLQGVIKAKCTLFDYLPKNGWGVVSRDYKGLKEEAEKHFSGIVTFSRLNRDGRSFARYDGTDEDGNGVYELSIDKKKLKLACTLSGERMAENVAAVGAVASLLEVDEKDIVTGLREFSPVEQRFAVRQIGEMTLIDDTYNANPLSMSQAMERAEDMAGKRQLVFVLGQMKELGSLKREEHIFLGEQIGNSRCSVLVFSGDSWKAVQTGLGNWNGRFRVCNSLLDFKEIFKEFNLDKDAVVLFKGSRSCRLEEYIKIIAETEH